MIHITDGLTKNQVKQIVKIAKGKRISTHIELQGLIYEAETKLLTITDGYVAVSWDLTAVAPEALPNEDTTVHFTKLNEWLVNATAKDVFTWDKVKEIGEYHSIPLMSQIYGGMETAKENESSRLDPDFFSLIAPLFLSPVNVKTIMLNSVSSIYFTVEPKHDDIDYKQTGIIMGMKK